jgi:hypothetical protein
MDRGFDNDGTISDLPWTAVFDPVANARALSAIQAEGFRAAAKLVDRFVVSAASNNDGTPHGAESPSDNSGNGSTPPPAGTDVDLIVRSWWSLWGRMLRSMPGVGFTGSAPATFELTGSNAGGAVHLHTDGAENPRTEIWLHNSGAEDMGDVGLLCGGLVSHDGGVIGPEAVRFTPDCVPMPERSSRGVTVEVEVSGVPVGRYRGSVLAQGHPDLWLPLVVDVRTPSE